MVDDDASGGGNEPSTARVVRASSEPTRARTTPSDAPIERPNSAVITAELPTYRPGPTTSAAPRSRYADPRPHGRSRRRDPAPILLRIFVWILAFIGLVAVVALITVRVHPSWLAFLRNTHVSAPTPKAKSNGPLTITSRHGSTVTYDVRTPGSGFTILVLPKTSALIQVKSPPTAPTYLYNRVLPRPSNGKPYGIDYVKQAASLHFDKAMDSIVIESGTTVLGTIADPTIGTTYIFTPKG